MNCYTRKGDGGKTGIFGSQVDKHDDRIEAIGSVDELNAFLGAAASFSTNELMKKIIFEIQNDLFTLGAELAQTGMAKVEEFNVRKLELLIDKLDDQLPNQTKFIIPAGTQAAMLINVARTVTRRTERTLVRLDRKTKINQELIKYSNRLSSLLHVLYRYENKSNRIGEKNPVYR